ncbi:MAG: PE-PPE domain-containing protein, partial [Mycobacterium sp.]|nr:PE-PPE domain-containing protein [Mycobacterium sp.]
MRTFTRSIGLVLASAGCAAGLGLSMSTPAVAANKALFVNGIAAGNLGELVMSNILGGMFGGSGYVRQNIPWPQQSYPITGPDSMTLTDSVAQGVVNLDTELKKALAQLGPGESVTIIGLSGGALVINDEVRNLATDPTAPDKSKLKIVVVADSSRVGFNKNRYDGIIKYQYRSPAETKYDTIAVAAEYDGFGDFPDRWWNFLAVANAFAGEIVTHVPTMLTDLDTVPASNITVTTNSLGGTTTSYLIPAKQLPLTILLPFLAPQEAELRAKIDTAYIRNDNKSSAAAVTAATAVEQIAGPAAVPAPSGGLPTAEIPAVAVQAPALREPEAPAAFDAARVADAAAEAADEAPTAGATTRTSRVPAADRGSDTTRPERAGANRRTGA